MSVVLDKTGSVWEDMLEEIISSHVCIIALRGAGSVSGIDKSDADSVVDRMIHMIDNRLSDGRVAIMYDGDDDDPLKPDIGHIMGLLRDHFDGQVSFYALQKLGWYRYESDLPALRPLHNASGKEYETVLFPDDTFPGGHDFFTQHESLVKYPGYEQWYIGACGTIAEKQLCDLAGTAFQKDVGPKVHIFRMPVSSKITCELEEKAIIAFTSWLAEALQVRRKNPYGLLFDREGVFIKRPGHCLLDITIV